MSRRKLTPLPQFFPLERTIALSDGVLAVVITLLILGIEVPESGNLSGPERILVMEKLGHQFLVYFVSFWILAVLALMRLWKSAVRIYSSREGERLTVYNGTFKVRLSAPLLRGAKEDVWDQATKWRLNSSVRFGWYSADAGARCSPRGFPS